MIRARSSFSAIVRSGVLGAVLLFASLPAYAAGSREGQAWTLGGALQAADRRAPQIIASVSRERLAESDVKVAGIVPNPRVTMGTSAASGVLVGSLYAALPVFGQRGTAIDAADSFVKVAALSVEVARLDARLAVTQAWIDLWLGASEQAAAERVAERRTRLHDAAQGRFEEGGGSRLDVLRADTELLRARGEASARRAETSAASARLALLLGIPPERSLQSVGDPPFARVIPTPAGCLQLVDTHPLARRANGSVQASEAVVRRERRARWPLLGVQLGTNLWKQYPPPRNDFSAALSAELPIFNAPLVARALAAKSTAQADDALVLTELRAGLLSVRSLYIAAERRQRSAEIEVLPIAREAAELAAEAYRSGALDLTATLLAEQSLADASIAAVRARADRGRAYAMLEHAAGRSLQ